MSTDESALTVRYTKATERLALGLEVQREGPTVMDSYQLPVQDTTLLVAEEGRDQGPEKDIMGEINYGEIRMIFTGSFGKLCILCVCSYHGGGRRNWKDPKEQAELHAKKRKEREKIASRGVPEVWAASPPRLELE